MPDRISQVHSLRLTYVKYEKPPRLIGRFTDTEAGIEVTLVGCKASQIDFSRFFQRTRLNWGYLSTIDLTNSDKQAWRTEQDGTPSLVIAFSEGNRPHLSGIYSNGHKIKPPEESPRYCTQRRANDTSEPDRIPQLQASASAIRKVLDGGLGIRILRINMKDELEPQSVVEQASNSIKKTNINGVTFVAEYVDTLPLSGTAQTMDNRV